MKGATGEMSDSERRVQHKNYMWICMYKDNFPTSKKIFDESAMMSGHSQAIFLKTFCNMICHWILTWWKIQKLLFTCRNI